MVPIHVVGIGLDGAAGLTNSVRQIVDNATLLVGSSRHLSYFPDRPVNRLLLTDLTTTIQQIRHWLTQTTCTDFPIAQIVILTSGDPLFFGLGRLLLAEFPAEQLTFHPHLSSIQLAFSRIKLPWQDVKLISAHGRSLDELIQAMQQGVEKIAVLTDPTNTPGAIAQLLQFLDLPVRYQISVCENLGGPDERILQTSDLAAIQQQTFAPLNVVVLQRMSATIKDLDIERLPLLGISDADFLSFPDRPGLMTKREIRVQILAELNLQPDQIVWDIGAGTGSVSIEIARLCPTSQIFAIEKTAIGSKLIQRNCHRFQVKNVTSIHGSAPEVLQQLPDPDRIFIGGSGGNLTDILSHCDERLTQDGSIVLALATIEHLHTALAWFNTQNSPHSKWNVRLLQVQLARSIPIANLTRFSPLNPVTIAIAEKQHWGYR
jgi:precorrin-6Y C5,15-methyltransferase (decarboxylating)